jgi:hypothetical protein
MKYFTGIFLIAVFFQLNATAQTTKIDEIDIKLNKASVLTASYPFDIPFVIKGEAPTNTVSINFRYRIKPDDTQENNGYKSWMHLPEPDGDYFLSDVWVNQGDKNFALYCKGMHPNVMYDFKFEIIKNLVLDTNQRKAIKRQLATAIQHFYAKQLAGPGTIIASDVAILNTDLHKILKKELIDESKEEKLMLKGNPPTVYIPDVATNLIGPYNLIADKFNTQMSAQNLILGNLALLNPELNTISKALIAEINTALSNKTVLQARSKELLEIKFNPSLEDFKNYTLRDGLKVLKALANKPTLLNDLTAGKVKISNSDFVDFNSTTPHLESIYFLNNLLWVLHEGVLVELAAKGKPRVMFKSLISTFMVYFKGYDANMRNWSKTVNEAAAALNSFPDLTLDLVSMQSLHYMPVIIPDVVTNKTPYLSANGGIGYSTSFQSALSYYGANFYFSPVNKRAKLSDFRGINYWKKVLFVNVSIANYFGSRPKTTSSILGEDSPSNLYIGLGARLNRIVELNAGFIPFKSALNPVTNNKDLRADFVVGAAIDVNLISAFGAVAQKLKITP